MISENQLYELVPDVADNLRLSDGVMIHLLSGFVDSGRITETLSEHLLDSLPHELLAEFDIDRLHDYRSRRPTMLFSDYQWTDSVFPTLRLYLMRDLIDEPFLMLAGPEPDLRWRRLADDIFQLCTQFGVNRLATGSGIPMTVPHTRPTILTNHGNAAPYQENNKYLFEQDIRVPGSFSALLEFESTKHGLAAFGATAYVPHYFGSNVVPEAALAVLSQLSVHTNIEFPLTELMRANEDLLSRLAKEMSGDMDFQEMVRRLESTYDEMQKHAVPSLDEIGQAVERFLAEHNRKDQRG